MSTQKDPDLSSLRREINEIDNQIFKLIKRRQELSLKVGEAKRVLNLPDRDFVREKEVFLKAIERAHTLQLPEQFAIDLQKDLIAISLNTQEKERIKSTKTSHAQKALVIGGAGRMGKWMCQFLADSGHEITVIDKEPPDFSCHIKASIDEEVKDFDLIIIATPIRVSVAILKDLLAYDLSRPVIFDVSSIKAPVEDVLEKMKAKSVKVTSIHPMFGPSVPYLFGRHVIRTSLGVEAADQAVTDLFLPTSLKLVDMSFSEHDQIISYLLAMSHLLNITFVDALRNSGFPLKVLEGFASTTFINQLNVAKAVLSENPKLYYEIQALNPQNPEAHEMLLSSLDKLIYVVSSKKEEGFLEVMQECKNYLNKAKNS